MSNSSNNNGINFMGLLLVLFIGLKLAGIIDWSWWWVMAPMWGTMALVVVVLAIFVFGCWIVSLFK